MSMVIPLFPKRRGMEQKMIRSIPLSLKGRGMEQKMIRTIPPSPKGRGMGQKIIMAGSGCRFRAGTLSLIRPFIRPYI